MGKVILVTSCKGGVGKSTVSSNLAVAMAGLFAPAPSKKKDEFSEIIDMNKRILIIDCDFGVRSLDLMYGVENAGIYDLMDILEGNASVDDTIRNIINVDNLDIIVAPMNFVAADFPKERFAEFIEYARKYYEYIILDSAPAHAESFYIAASVCDSALIVSNSSSCALRASAKTSKELENIGCTDTKLVINMFDPKSILRREFFGIMTSIDIAGTQLVGIIPKDRTIPIKQEHGETLDLKKDKTGKYFIELAKRVIGFNIPLTKKIMGINTKKLF